MTGKPKNTHTNRDTVGRSKLQGSHPLYVPSITPSSSIDKMDTEVSEPEFTVSEESLQVTDADTDDLSAVVEDGEDSATPSYEAKYRVFQKVLAKDNDTPLLYQAVVRKIVWAPKSQKVNLSLMESSDDEEEGITEELESFTWHYFVHFVGWKVQWDRWVEEEKLFDDNEDARILAKRLKEESKVLKKNQSKKKFVEVMQRIVKLERELREKQARGESIEKVEDEKAATEVVQPTQKTRQDEREKEKNEITKAILAREVKLRKLDLRSRKCSINVPFPLKKILTDDWEVITQCEMLHSMPATVSVKHALDAYLETKLKMLNGGRTDDDIVEEKKDDGTRNISKISVYCNGQTHEPIVLDNHGADDGQEWRDMVDGIAIFFDQALTKNLLYRHEIPQCRWLEQNHEKRYSELYPCEYLIRLCLKLPDVIADTDYPEDQKAKILVSDVDVGTFYDHV